MHHSYYDPPNEASGVERFDPVLQLLLATYLESFHDPLKAINRWRQLVSEFPDDPTVQHSKAYLELLLGQFESAVESFRTAVRLESQYQAARDGLNLARAILASWNYQQSSMFPGESPLARQPQHFVPLGASLPPVSEFQEMIDSQGGAAFVTFAASNSIVGNRVNAKLSDPNSRLHTSISAADYALMYGGRAVVQHAFGPYLDVNAFRGFFGEAPPVMFFAPEAIVTRTEWILSRVPQSALRLASRTAVEIGRFSQLPPELQLEAANQIRRRIVELMPLIHFHPL
jgi:tetratricopeptide (TPR) repeat protein